MVAPTITLQLRIEQTDKNCIISLIWAEGHSSGSLPYPSSLDEKYQNWQRNYSSCYKSLLKESDQKESDRPIQDNFRARSETLPPHLEVERGWHERLKISEELLLEEFHRWLREIEMKVGQQIIQIASRSPSQSQGSPSITLLIVCDTALAKLPWETWEIATRLNLITPVHIGLMPPNVHHDVVQPKRRLRRKIRVLAIIGETDETQSNRLNRSNFRDAQLWQQHSKLIDLRTVQKSPDEEDSQFNIRLLKTIGDSRGWDALFFAGHSDESQIVNGTLEISPGNWIALESLKPRLEKAKQNGLQFALFNSCCGFNFAEGLIDMGLGQVIVMREKIHHDAALQFLKLFLHHLTQYKSVWEAFRLSRQQLAEEQISYPSAYLLPALFSHPNAIALQLDKPNWKRVLPNRWEAIACGLVLASCLWEPTQDVWFNMQSLLVNQRTWVQAMYRDVTHQIPEPPTPPLVRLVQIDGASLQTQGIRDAELIDRRYLAGIVDRLSSANARVIGIDYLLSTADGTHLEGDRALSGAIQQAVKEHQTWLVLGTDKVRGREDPISPTIASPTYSLQAYLQIDKMLARMELLHTGSNCQQLCPFAYLLALVHSDSSLLPPNTLKFKGDLRSYLIDIIHQNEANSTDQTLSLSNLRLPPITAKSQQFFYQSWFRPLLDFSIPPTQIYQQDSAQDLFDASQREWQQNLSQQVVIVAPGGYEDAGDNFTLPPALRYWQAQNQRQTSAPTRLTGGEIHAYTIHHLLTRHLVIPVPDLLMMGIAAIAGCWIALGLGNSSQRQQTLAYLATGNSLYGLISLQLYVSTSVLIPVVLPSIVFWLYITSGLRR